MEQKTPTEMLGEIYNSPDIEASITQLMEMEDDKFTLIAPLIIEGLAKEFESPETRAVLLSSLERQGLDINELGEQLQKATEEINKTDLSEPKKDFYRQIFGVLTAAILGEVSESDEVFIPVAFEVMNEKARLPEYAHISDSGMDIFALEDITINPSETKLIHTGLKAALPTGFELQVRPKSGRSLKTKLRIANTPGTIDAGYRDEICVIMENIEPPFKDITYDFDDAGHIIITSILHGECYTIHKGEKFAQLVLMPVPKAAVYQVEDVTKVEDVDENRNGGFGSTDNK